MNIFHAKFSTGQIAQATGVNNDTLQNWMKRGLIVGQREIEGGGSQGRHRQYSFHNLMEIAAAKALVDAGMSDLKSVFYAAHMFAHTGNAMPNNRVPERVPGCPYNGTGITLLVAGMGWADEVFLSPKDTALGLYTKLMNRAHQSMEGCVLVNASQVFDRAVAGIGHHPEAVLAIAYPKEAMR